MINNPQAVQNKINEQSFIIQQLSNENNQLKDKVKYLEDKIKQLINEKIQERMKDKQIQLSSKGPTINTNPN
jgi:cell division protein FtsB